MYHVVPTVFAGSLIHYTSGILNMTLNLDPNFPSYLNLTALACVIDQCCSAHPATTRGVGDLRNGH